MKDIVFATNNAHKLRELREIARDKFNINSGDKLLLLGDEDRGIAIVHERDLINFVGMMGMAMKDD